MGEVDRQQEEIDLYELILILKKRIKYVIIPFVLGVAIATVVSFLMPNIYQARATLWVDSLLGQQLIENLERKQFTRDNKLSLIIPLQQGRSQDVNNLSLSILNSIEFKKKVLNTLKKIYPDGKDLNKIEEAVNSGKGGVLFKADIDRKTGSIVLTSEQKDRKLAEEILKVVIDEFRGELYRASLAYSETFVSDKTKIDKEKNNFVLYVVENPNSLEKPVKPKRAVIVMVSAVSSLFIGVFLAFLVEWWSNVKGRKEA